MVKNNAFGFDPMNVFGDVRKESRKMKKKNGKDSMAVMQGDSMSDGFGLGIDTFSLADPNIDALGIGGDFGEMVGARAGKANGDGGFLGIIGGQQVSVPSVTGKGRIARGVSRGGGRKAKKRLTPLQAHTGTRFGEIDKQFGDNLAGNISGIRKRVSDFRIKRKTRKQIQEEPEREPRQLEGNQRALPFRQEEPTPIEQRTPALPDRTQTLPRESGSEAIARLREEASSRGAT